MKKRLFLLLLVLLNVCNVKISANDDDIFEWGSFNVVVEHSEDLQIVLNEIKSNIKLKNGYKDNNFYVENNNVNYTTQSSINTNYLKTYRLDHRAVSPKYNKSEVRSYYLHVVDNLSPVVISSKSFIMAYGSEIPNYLEGLVVKDNVTPEEDIKITINDLNVNYEEIGIYPIIYTLTDNSGNSTIYKEFVEIVDLVKPTIKIISDLLLQVGEEFILESHFLIEDNYDSNLIINYKFKESLDKLGKVNLELEVEDQSGNKNTFNGFVEVIDNISPVIILNDQELTIEVFNEVVFLSLVEVYDNYDELTKEDLIIEENVLYDVIGVYDVIYKVKDSSNNETIKTLKIAVKDLTGPVIFANDIEVKKNDSIDFLMNVNVEDNYSKRNNITLKIVYNDVKFTKPGKYNITFEAVDESGNHSHKTITVTVSGTTSSQKTFYILLIIGITSLSAITIIYIFKKRKKTY